MYNKYISQEVFIMARRNESNEEKNRRKLVESFLSENPIKDPNDIQEMMRQVLEGGLTAELDDELGYTRYDYRNKETERYIQILLY